MILLCNNISSFYMAINALADATDKWSGKVLDPDQRDSLGLLPTISHSRQEMKRYVLMQNF